MILLPPRLPERGWYRALYAWLNKFLDYTASITIKSSRTVRVTRTREGTVLEVILPSPVKQEVGEGDEATWL